MERVFDIIPASAGPYIFIWALSLILIAVIGLLIYVDYSSRDMYFILREDGLKISPRLYGRFIPRQDINTEGIRVLNLNKETDYQPKMRTNGAGLPGYSAGWFKLQNKEKALVFVTDKSSVVFIPTNKDYSVVLSVKEAEEFAELIKRWE